MTLIDFATGHAGNVLMSGMVGGIAGITTGVAVVRHQSNRRRIARLERANSALRKHIEWLKALDRDDTPDEVLELAIKFSEMLQSSTFPTALSAALRENPRAFASPSYDTERSKRWEIIKDTPPEIVHALVSSIISGLKALTERYPEIRPAFEDILVDIGVAPFEEAQRVIRVTGQAISFAPGRTPVVA